MTDAERVAVLEREVKRLSRESKGQREEIDALWTYIRNTDTARSLLASRSPVLEGEVPP